MGLGWIHDFWLDIEESPSLVRESHLSSVYVCFRLDYIILYYNDSLDG